MPISFIGSATSPGWPGSTPNNTSSITIGKPGGTVSGDLLLAVIVTSAGTAITPPGGWTLAHEQDNGINIKGAVYVKAAGGSEPASYVFTDNSGNAAPLCGAIHTYRGVETSVMVHQITRQASTTTDPVTSPSVTTTIPCMLLHVCCTRTTSDLSNKGTHAAATNYTVASNYGNRGNTVQYFGTLQTPTASTVSPAGTYSGISFDADSTHSPTNGVQFQVAIPEFQAITATPPAGSETATAYAPTSINTAEGVPQAAVTATAYNATGALGGDLVATPPQTTVTATAYNAAAYFGAPDSRKLNVEADVRSLAIPNDPRSWLIPGSG